MLVLLECSSESEDGEGMLMVERVQARRGMGRRRDSCNLQTRQNGWRVRYSELHRQGMPVLRQRLDERNYANSSRI